MADPVSITSLMALYGVVLSSIGVVWNLYRDLQDKARLKVEMHIRRIVRSPDGKSYQVRPDLPFEGASEQLFLVVNVTNVGRRPVKWTGWGGKYQKRKPAGNLFIIPHRQLPIMLKEGDSFSVTTDDLKAAGDNVKKLFICDATGKNWYLSRRELKKLKGERHEFQPALHPPE